MPHHNTHDYLHQHIRTVAETYELEYGSATGGTMMAGRKLLERLGATVMEGAAIVDLPELGGSQRLKDSGLDLFTLVDFSGH